MFFEKPWSHESHLSHQIAEVAFLAAFSLPPTMLCRSQKRRLVDSCGHERCYSCIGRNDGCSLCQQTGTYHQHYPILSRIIQYYQVLSNVIQYYPIISKIIQGQLLVTTPPFWWRPPCLAVLHRWSTQANWVRHCRMPCMEGWWGKALQMNQERRDPGLWIQVLTPVLTSQAPQTTHSQEEEKKCPEETHMSYRRVNHQPQLRARQR